MMVKHETPRVGSHICYLSEIHNVKLHGSV